MKHLVVSCAVRPIQWPLGVKWLILTGWKIVPNEEHVQCHHRFASQPLANEPLNSSQLFDTSLQKARGTTSLCGP